MSPHIRPLKIRVIKPKTKGTKADSMEKVTVAELLPALGKLILNLMISLILLFSKSIKKSSLIFLFPKDLSIRMYWHQPVMELLLLLHTENAKSATAKRKASPTANVTVTFPSLTVISDGILHVTVFIMVTTCTCLSIPRVTYLCSRIFHMLQNTIPTNFCMLISE